MVHCLQVTCPVYKEDTAATLAQRIHTLEHEHFARVVDECLTGLERLWGNVKKENVENKE